MQRAAQIARDQLGRAFRRLERDIAGEAVGDGHVHGALGDVIAFDEAAEFHRQIGRAQHLGGAFHGVVALHFFRADVEQADARTREPRTARAKASPITAKSTSCSASHSMLAPQSSTTVWPRLVGHTEAMAGRVDAVDQPELVHRHRHQRAGVAGRDDRFRLAALHGFDGAPHAGVAAAAQREARLLLHRHPPGAWRTLTRWPNLRGACRISSFERGLVAVEDEFHGWVALQGPRECRYDNRRAGIAAHRVYRHHQFAGHVLTCPYSTAEARLPRSGFRLHTSRPS